MQKLLKVHRLHVEPGQKYMSREEGIWYQRLSSPPNVWVFRRIEGHNQPITAHGKIEKMQPPFVWVRP